MELYVWISWISTNCLFSYMDFYQLHILQVDISDLHDDDDGNVFLLRGLVDDCKLDNSAFNLSECEGNT